MEQVIISEKWKHYDRQIQCQRASVGDFDSTYITKTGSFPHIDLSGCYVDYKRGHAICGNFLFIGEWQYITSNGQFFKSKFEKPFQIFRVLNSEYIKAQETEPELLKTKAFRLDNCCSKCKKQFSTTRGVTKHTEKNKCGFKSVQCFCSKWFKNERGLNIHQKKYGCSSALIDEKPLLNKQIRLHKKQIRPAFAERNNSNTIHFICLCGVTTISEVSMKKHIYRRCPYTIAELEKCVYWRSEYQSVRGYTKRYKVCWAKDDINLFNYLFRKGQRPTNILNDTRMLGFRYIGERTANMDLTPFLTQEQQEYELSQQKVYGSAFIKTRGLWF